MRRTTIALARVCTLLLFAIIFTAPLGCRKSAPPALAPADQTYTVRALVIGKPSDTSYLQLHHEAIPDFRNREGKITGMKEMVMEFAELNSAATAALAALNEGDPVEVIFEVRWNSDPRMLVTSLRKLSEDQTPTFGRQPEPR